MTPIKKSPDASKANVNPAPKKTEYGNTDRDDATTGTSHPREAGDAGFADEDQPPWSPPESKPEPRPAETILNPSQS